MSNYAQFFAILTAVNKQGAELDRKELVKQFTNGKTDSLSSMNTFEYNEMIKHLMEIQSRFKPALNDPLDQTRKAIISQFKSIGKTTKDAKDWAEKYGVFGAKKKFNDYNGQELWQLLQNAKTMRQQTIKRVYKSF